MKSLELLGHRGARGLAPENTLPGFARTFGIGVSGVELDCAITRDGVVVIYHDAILNPDITRGPDGKWPETAGPAIADLTYSELQRYDVGRIRPASDYERRFPHQQPVDGTRIPKLADLFALAGKARNDTARFYLELKVSPLAPRNTIPPEDFARSVIEAVKTCGMAQRSLILSFDWRTLAAAKRIAPEIPTVCLTAQQPWLDNLLARRGSSPWTAPLHIDQFGGSVPRLIQATGGSAWAAFHEEISAEQVREAHSLGLKVVAWTVNEDADLKRAIGLGVNGVISDYPDRLRQVAGELGIALPASKPVSP